jgi:hypothetical protein
MIIDIIWSISVIKNTIRLNKSKFLWLKIIIIQPKDNQLLLIKKDILIFNSDIIFI